MKRKVGFTFLLVLIGILTGVCQNSVVVATAAKAVNSQGATAGVTVGQLTVGTASNASGLVSFGIWQAVSDEVSALATIPIQNIEVNDNENVDVIRLDKYFVSKEPLLYTASSSDKAVVNPVIDDSNLTLILGGAGSATVTVVATTSSGKQESLSFTVTVESTEPIYSSAKEELTALYEEAIALLGSVTSLSSALVFEYYVALDNLSKQVQQCLENDADEKKCVDLSSKMKKSIADLKSVWTPTAVAEIVDEPIVRVVERTIYMGNLNGCDVALYTIDGKRLYMCRNAMNTQITVYKAGLYVLKVGRTQRNIMIQ